MEEWLVLQNFYEGLTPMSKGHIDATAGGVFSLSLPMQPRPSSKRWWLTRAGDRNANNKKACIP
jgi:hypothetical protein